MSQPLAIIGDAIVEVIGISPLIYARVNEANWPGHAVFDGEPYYQPTSRDDKVETLHLACRPHLMGGLDNHLALERHCERLEPVPFIRMSGLVGGFQGMVAVRTVSKEEAKIAPDGAGWRWEFTVELLYIGEIAGTGF
jgi:phage protein U